MKTTTALFIATNFPPTRAKIDALIADGNEPIDIWESAVFAIVDSMDACWAAWERHPLRTKFEQDGICFTPDNPPAVAYYAHPLGKGMLQESWMVSDVRALIEPTNWKWGAKHLGQFVCISPLDEQTPIDAYRVLSRCNALLSRHEIAYASRLKLREWLPTKLHPLIKTVRHVNSHGKVNLFGTLRDAGNPDWKLTKAQLWAKRYITDEQRIALEKWIDPALFWKAVIGDFHPESIPDLINPDKRMAQMRLF